MPSLAFAFQEIELSPEYPAGNYVVIEHPNKEYSMIAHFKNGSILVKEGEQVKEGQLLGQCGNSGNSSEGTYSFSSNGPTAI